MYFLFQCEWLLGENKYNLENLGPELDSDSSIYKAIMNNPHIQLSLTDPNMLLGKVIFSNK